MSITFITRDYLNQGIPIFYQTQELVEKESFNYWIDFLQSFCIFFETSLPTRLFSFISFQWKKDLTHLPIIKPEVNITQTNFILFSNTTFSPRDLFSKKLNLLPSITIKFPINIVLNGFFNALFFAIPRNLNFLIGVRRYWLQGFLTGLRSSFGYRRGETILLRGIANRFRPIWWSTSFPLPFEIRILVNFFLLWESFSYSNCLSWKSNFFGNKMRRFSVWIRKRKLRVKKDFAEKFTQNRRLIYIFFFHFLCAWDEERMIFGMFKNQTFVNIFFSISISYFSLSLVISLNYLLGTFFGSLFYDFCFRMRFLRITENLILRLRHSPFKWKEKLHKWTSKLLITLSFRIVPFYGANYLAFNGLGFSDRDTELRRNITRNIFSYSIVPGRPLSILFERRNVIGEDSYGQSTPDTLREPWQINRLSVETRRDLVDETYRTQQTNQRVDNVYLGIFERKIFEWLTVRNPKKFSFIKESPRFFNPKKNQTRKSRKKRLGKKRVLFVSEPVRKGFGLDVTPRDSRHDSFLRKSPPKSLERSLIRFDHWFRARQRKKKTEDQRIFGLPLGRLVKVPESLFALSTNHFSQQPYLSSIGIMEPQQTICYLSSIELARKRNARRSPLYHRTISS